MAYGVLGMTPQQFGDMTVGEFLAAVRGFFWLRERDAKDRAYALANIVGTCGHIKKGHKVRITDFYREMQLNPENSWYRSLVGVEERLVKKGK